MKKIFLELDDKLFLQLWEYALRHKVKGSVNKSNGYRKAFKLLLEVEKKMTDEQVDKLLSMSKEEINKII